MRADPFADQGAVGIPHLGGMGMDGFSIRPLIEDPSGRWGGPDSALVAWMGAPTQAQRENPYAPAEASRQHFAVATDRYRYIRAATGEEELYDHAADPHEWENLARNPEHAPVLREMATRLERHLSPRAPRPLQ